MNNYQEQGEVIIPEMLEGAPEDILKIYQEWFKRDKEFKEREDRYFKYQLAENETVTIDLFQASHIVNKKLKLLPRNEIKKLHPVISQIRTERGKIGILKKKWMGWSKGEKNASIASLDPFAATIIELYGQYKTNNEILQIIEENFGLKIKIHKLTEFKTKNLDKINKLKSQWEGSYDEFSVTRKRGRIERLVYLLQTQTDEYKRSNTFPVPRSREIRETLKQIKDEIEGNKIQVDINGNINITASINMNMNIRELTRRVSLNSFIVALVAGMRGVNEARLMNRLTNSYYRSFNGFIESDGTQQITYPSDLINHYDWNVIQKRHEQPQEQEAEVIQEETKPEQVDLKEKLMQLMSNKFGELDKSKKITEKK